MSEVPMCPVCGEKPFPYHYDEHIAYAHCGVKCGSLEIWNRYAAAIELAKAEVAFDKAHNVSDDRLENAVNTMADVVLEKLHHVLEVFK